MTVLNLYWMKNHDWFAFDENGKAYLTDKATPKAKESFNEYKRQLKEKKNTI